MIYGIGTDIVSIERVQKILNKNRDGFINRVLTEHEKALFANKADSAAFCAKRFAAKEAFSKAIGTGFRENLNFRDITVINDKLGKPSFVVTDKIKKIVKKQFKISSFDFFLSISDEKKYSIAYVILQKK